MWVNVYKTGRLDLRECFSDTISQLCTILIFLNVEEVPNYA